MPIHPGHVLQDSLGGIDLSHAAEALGITPEELQKLFDGRLAVSEQLARRLEALLRFKAEHWLAMQRQWDDAQQA